MPSAMCKNRVFSLLRSPLTSDSVVSSTWAISPNVRVNVPISSEESVCGLWEKSPLAMRVAIFVRFWTGTVMVRAKMKLNMMATARPNIRERSRMVKIFQVRSLSSVLLSTTAKT